MAWATIWATIWTSAWAVGCAPGGVSGGAAGARPAPRGAAPRSMPTRTDLPDDYFLLRLNVPMVRKAPLTRPLAALLERLWRDGGREGTVPVPAEQNPFRCVPLADLGEIRFGGQLLPGGQLQWIAYVTSRTPAAGMLRCADQAVRRSGAKVRPARVGDRAASEHVVGAKGRLTLWIAGPHTLGLSELAPTPLGHELIRARQTRLGRRADFQALTRRHGADTLVTAFVGRDAVAFEKTALGEAGEALQAIALVAGVEKGLIALQVVARLSSVSHALLYSSVIGAALQELRQSQPEIAGLLSRIRIVHDGKTDVSLSARLTESDLRLLLLVTGRDQAPVAPPRRAPPDGRHLPLPRPVP